MQITLVLYLLAMLSIPFVLSYYFKNRDIEDTLPNTIHDCMTRIKSCLKNNNRKTEKISSDKSSNKQETTLKTTLILTMLAASTTQQMTAADNKLYHSQLVIQTQNNVEKSVVKHSSEKDAHIYHCSSPKSSMLFLVLQTGMPQIQLKKMNNHILK